VEANAVDETARVADVGRILPVERNDRAVDRLVAMRVRRKIVGASRGGNERGCETECECE